MSGLSARFEAMSLDARVEFVLNRSCSPEARNIILKLQTRVVDLEGQFAAQDMGLSFRLTKENIAFKARVSELEGELAKALALVNAARFCDFAVRSKHAEKLAAWADKCGGTGIIYALPDQSGEGEQR